MNRKARRVVLTIVPWLVLAVAPVQAGTGNCLKTRIDADVVLPDGSVHAPGVVTICPESVLSPAVRLCSISVNGRTHGLWMNRVSEGGRFVADDGTIALRRLASGRVALADYYWPGTLVPPPVTAIEPAAEADGLFTRTFNLQ